MKNLKLKKTMTRLISIILVLATVMGISCTCIISASAQSMSSTDELIQNSFDITNCENMSLDELMTMLMLMVYQSETERREAMSTAKKVMYEETVKQLTELGYDKEDVVDYLMENYPEEVSFYLEKYTRIKEVLDEYGIVIDKDFFSL